MRRQVKHVNTSLRITVAYIIISVLWILLTDRFIPKLFHYPYLIDLARCILVLVTGFILYQLMHRSHESLKQSRQDYQNLIDLGREPMLIHADGKIVDINEYAVMLFDGLNKAEFIGKFILDFPHPTDQELARRRLSQLQGRVPTDVTEMKIITLTGALKYIELVGIPIEFRGAPAVQLMLRDITSRKATERNLNHVVQLFRLIEENTMDLIAILNEDGSIRYSSRSHQRVLGRDMAVGNNRPLDIHVHPEDRTQVLSAYSDMMQTKQPLRAEFRLRHAKGHWVHVEMHGNPFADSEGHLRGAILVTRDITERKLTEDLLRRSDRLSAVGQLAAGLAHEVRNPVTVLQGFIQLLRASEKPNDQHISIMLSELQRIESIITEFLVFAKAAPTRLKDANICRIMRDIIALLSPQASMKSVEIRAEFEVESAVIHCNEDHLKQVFINVIKNAIEAMPGGGSIVVRLEKRQDVVAVFVIDQGEGIPEHLISRIGEPFLTTKENGTGLGLLVTHKLIENHNGRIGFRSRPGEGTAVEIMLPLANEGELNG